MTNAATRMIIFDDGLGHLGPMTELRAAFEVRTGVYTTAGRLRAARPKTLGGYWVPAALAPLVASRADAPVNDLPGDEMLLCANGRWAMPSADVMASVHVGSALVESATGHILVANLRHADAEYFLTTGELHERVQVRHVQERVLYRYPWEVIGLLKDTISHDLATIEMIDAGIPDGAADIVGGHPVEVHATSTIFRNVVFDATEGPIAVHENAIVRPGAILCGPCSIGRGTTVIDRAHIKANTVIGPVCKVGGEVGSTIFQGYANKSHEGHLGDSWVGKWVNFGAGTTNSNLLNTYGEVNVRLVPGGPRHRTGLTFLGAMIGDHAKTAIGTRLMTGSIIGTGAMIACTLTPPTTIAPFAWLTDDGQRVYRLEKFLQVAQTVMERRGRKLTPELRNVVTALYNAVTGT